MYNNTLSDSLIKFLESLAATQLETEPGHSPLIDSEKYQLGVADGEILLARRILESLGA